MKLFISIFRAKKPGLCSIIDKKIFKEKFYVSVQDRNYFFSVMGNKNNKWKSGIILLSTKNSSYIL